MKWISKIFRRGFFGKKSSIIKDFLRHPDDYEINIQSGIWMNPGCPSKPTEEIRIRIKRRIDK